MRNHKCVLLACLLLGWQSTVVGADGPAPKKVFVVNTQGASVSLVDLATFKVERRIDVGEKPYGITLSSDGSTLAVGVEGEEQVKFYDTAEFRLLGATPIGKMHNDHIIRSRDGQHVLVANFYSDDVVAIDIATRKEAYRIEGCSAPHVIKYGPLGKLAYVTCKKITGIAIVDPAEKKLVQFHQLNVNPRSLTFSPDETKLFFGSFWVNGFFEMDVATGKVTRLFELPPAAESALPQEVTYHGVEAAGADLVLAANEGRSYLDAVNVRTGARVSRLTDVAKPCCVERIPGPSGAPVRVLVSNLGDDTLQLVEVSTEGQLKSLHRVTVGKAPKRVAFWYGTDVKTSAAPAKKWTFDDDAPGEVPGGFEAPVGTWAITGSERERSVAQQAKSSGPTFNLLLASEPNVADVDVSVRLKPVAGEIDQGGGVVWRAQDASNYYIARYNPLESNYRLYHVIDGKRTQLATAKVEARAGWRELRVTMTGKRIACYLDDQKHLEAEDATLASAGRVGLWTKADAQTLFDDLKASGN